MRIAVSSQPWQPLTLGGVAAFGHASLGRLLKVQTAGALLVSLSVLWLLAGGFFPEFDRAIASLPADCEIRNRRLRWEAPAPTVLAEGPFLAITVNLEGAGAFARGADLQLELGRDELRIRSFLGYVSLRYPANWTITLNRVETQARWGAWRGFLLIGAGLATTVLLLASWAIIAVVYSIPVRSIAFYADRQVTAWGAWKLAAAALLPGAVLVSAAICLYRFQRLTLLALLLAWLLHWVVGWIYAGLAPFRLPRAPGTGGSRGNPFDGRRGRRSGPT